MKQTELLSKLFAALHLHYGLLGPSENGPSIFSIFNLNLITGFWKNIQ